MSFGWAGQILRVDLSNRESSIEPVEPYTRSLIGGRGISVKMLYDEVDPQLSPHDPANKLFLGPGVLAGTPAAGSSRLKITGLAAGGFLRHSGLGGHIPKEIKCAGYDIITIQGKLDKPGYLYIHDDSVEFKDASHIWGKDTYETQQMIKDELGQSVEVMCIGPGGENGVTFGSVHTDWGSAAGLCGFGGVLGSKNLKAIAVKGTRGVKIAKLEEFLKVAEEQRESFANNEAGIKAIKIDAGSWLAYDWQLYGLGSRGNFEDAPSQEAEWVTTMDEFNSKYGICTHVCGSCPISHFFVYEIPGIGKGGAKCTGLSSVTLTLWNTDWKVAVHAYNLINRYGMDVIATTNIIAFLMELYDKGIITAKDTDGIPMKRGDENAIISTLHKIGKQEGFGKLFKDGVVQAARRIGKDAEYYAMAVKGLELEPYTYRGLKQYALAQAINTKGMIDGAPVPVDVWTKTADEAVRDFAEKMTEEMYGTREAALPQSYLAAPTIDWENKVAGGDMVGVCKWLIPWFMTSSLEIPAKLFSLATGVEMDEAGLLLAARRVLTLERAINVIRGMRRKDDTLPKRFFEEPVPSGRFKGDRLEKAKFDKMVGDYYALCGYDDDGVPKEEAFMKYGLSSEWKVFKKKVPRVEKETSAGAEA